MRDVLNMKATFGFSGVPITEEGVLGSRLLGFVGSRDVDFGTDPMLPVTEVMTPFTDLVVARDDTTLAGANKILRDSKKGCAARWVPRVNVQSCACLAHSHGVCMCVWFQEAAHRG